MIAEGSILTILKSILEPILKPVFKRYYDQPKIYLIFSGSFASRWPGPLSPNNDFSKPLDAMNHLRIDKLIWRYNLELRNNSEHAAYNIKLISPKEDECFRFVDKIDSLKPLLQNAQVVFRVTFEKQMEGTGMETWEATKTRPDYWRQCDFILEYSNVRGTKFYTAFSPTSEKDDQNQFFKRIPKH